MSNDGRLDEIQRNIKELSEFVSYCQDHNDPNGCRSAQQEMDVLIEEERALLRHDEEAEEATARAEHCGALYGLEEER